jgi:hypothetical protein
MTQNIHKVPAPQTWLAKLIMLCWHDMKLGNHGLGWKCEDMHQACNRHRELSLKLYFLRCCCAGHSPLLRIHPRINLRSRLTRFALLALLGVGLLTACSKQESDEEPYFVVEEVGLKIPQMKGWQLAAQFEAADLDEGGTLLRLEREYAAPGSPRLDVVVKAAKEFTPSLEPFVYQELRQMGELEKKQQLRIIKVTQEPIYLGARKAYFVRHDYTMGKKPLELVFIQLSVFLIVDGREITVTALGRHELVTPLSRDIEDLLKGIVVGTYPTRTLELKSIPSQNKVLKPLVKERKGLDLGVIGGN